MNPLHHPADCVPAIIVLTVLAWVALAVAIAAASRQPNDGE